MITLGIASCNYGRIEVFEIFCAGIRRLREDLNMDIPCSVAGERPPKVEELCSKYNIHHIETPNKPLTAKFNTACFDLKGRCDAVMILGSDNLISSSAVRVCLSQLDAGSDLVGFTDVYFYALDGLFQGGLYHFHRTTVLGVGRTIASRVLYQVEWNPWKEHRDRSIDVLLIQSLEPYIKDSVLLEGHFIVDLKTKHNLNPITFWAKSLPKMNDNYLLHHSIGKEESELIRSYLARQSKNNL